VTSTFDPFVRPWVGPACRHVPDRADTDILDVRFAGTGPASRWNEPGEPTLYLAGDHGVAIAEFARHYDANRRPPAGGGATMRRLYDLQVAVDRTLDLRDTRLLAALSLPDAPACFLDRAVCRAVAGFLRTTTAAQALLVPSVAFLDDPNRWVLALFLDKLPGDVGRFLPTVRANGTFGIDPHQAANGR
jgi:RES domain-containing protein